MRVTRRTPDQLIVEDRPWLITIALSVIFLGTVSLTVFLIAASEFLIALCISGFAAYIGLFIAVFVQRIQVIFDRSAGTVTHRKRSLLRYREVVRPLGELDRAVCTGGDTKRPELVFGTGMSGGQHPITVSSVSGPGPERIAEAINDWLNTRQT